MSANGQRYNVGGILLERPFKIRRLGHFGFNLTKLEEARHFYGDLLGFIVSDKADFSRAPWFPKDQGLGDTHGYFMRYGTDHHAMVLFSKPVMDQRADRKFAPERDDQPDHLAMRQPQGDRRGAQLFPGTAGPRPARRARHAGQQLACLCLRPRRPHQRTLLRHRADRLEPAIKAARDVLPRLPGKARIAADVGSGRACRGRGEGHRRLFRPPPGCCPMAARNTMSTACCCRGRSRSPRSARCGCLSTMSTAPSAFYTRAPRLDEKRGERTIAARAACFCAAAPSTTRWRSTQRNCAACSA